jgi:hypothetical protein
MLPFARAGQPCQIKALLIGFARLGFAPLAHDREKPALGPDPKRAPVFAKDYAQN